MFWVLLWHCFAASLIPLIDQLSTVFPLSGWRWIFDAILISFFFDVFEIYLCADLLIKPACLRLFFDIYILASWDQISTLTQFHWPQVIYSNCQINLALFYLAVVTWSPVQYEPKLKPETIQSYSFIAYSTEVGFQTNSGWSWVQACLRWESNQSMFKFGSYSNEVNTAWTLLFANPKERHGCSTH